MWEGAPQPWPCEQEKGCKKGCFAIMTPAPLWEFSYAVADLLP